MALNHSVKCTVIQELSHGDKVFLNLDLVGRGGFINKKTPIQMFVCLLNKDINK